MNFKEKLFLINKTNEVIKELERFKANSDNWSKAGFDDVNKTLDNLVKVIG